MLHYLTASPAQQPRSLADQQIFPAPQMAQLLRFWSLRKILLTSRYRKGERRVLGQNIGVGEGCERAAKSGNAEESEFVE